MDDVIVLSDSDESNDVSNIEHNKRNVNVPTTNLVFKSSDSDSLDNILNGNYQLKKKHTKLSLSDSDEEICNLVSNKNEKKDSGLEISDKTSNGKRRFNNKDPEEKEWSDSDFPDINIRKTSEPKGIDDDNLSDFEFPDISLLVNKNSERKDPIEKEWSDSDFPDTDIYLGETSKEKNTNTNNCYLPESNDDVLILKDIDENEFSDSDFPEINKNSTHKKLPKESESDSDYETQNPLVNCYKQYKEKQTVDHLNIESSDENNEWSPISTGKNKKSKDKATKSKKESNEEKKRIQEEKRLQREAEKRRKEEEKIRKKEEREQERIRKQKEQAKQKALKQMNSKNRLNFDPDYSMKLMKVIFDEELENFDFFTDFIKSTEESEVAYNVQSQLIPKSITWTRRVEENYVNDMNEVCSNSRIVEESHVMIIWDCKETIKHVADGTLTAAISNIKSLVSSNKIYLVMYKVHDYFKFLKQKKDRNVRDEILGEAEKPKKSKTKFDKSYADMPIVSKTTFEKYLIEIQLFHNVSSRLIENELEMVLLINQYTKSLALLPLKMEKRNGLKLDWHVNCDNRDTVKVDKDGNGLKRLWQQQLCQFNLTSLETSEAITSVYKSPLDLMDAYEKCTPAEGELLLKDIPIRRAAGILTTVRKIGPELSKKIYLMFTTENGEIYLKDSNE